MRRVLHGNSMDHGNRINCAPMRHRAGPTLPVPREKFRGAAVDEIEQHNGPFDIAFEKQELRQHVALFEVMILGGKAFSEVMLDHGGIVGGLF
jgi:hypothetical protein